MMHKEKFRIILLILLIFSLSFKLQAQNIKALVGGTLIDGFGGPPLRNSVIIIENERIKEIGQVGTLQVPQGAEVISTEGMSVMPGLWDMHVHLMINGHSNYTHWDSTYIGIFESVIMPSSAHQLLLAGVTSARDLGAPLQASINVRDKINRGEIPGPTIYVSGPFIQKAPYPGTEEFRWGINGPQDARAKVKKLIDGGVDVIKLIDHDEMTFEEAKAVVDEAHKYGKPVIAHSHRPDEIRIGMKIGVDCFEHTGLSSAPEYPEDIIDLIKERTAKMNMGPLFWTPTVEGLYNYEYMRNNPEKLDDPSWHLGLPDSVIRDIRASLRFPGRMPYFQLTPVRKPTLERKINQLKDAGVVLMIGTDSGIPMKFHSQSTWNELDVWVNEFGFDPMLTIKAATYWPAVSMRVENDYGTVSEGKYADIIAVRGDVLRYISLLQNVDMVIKHGKRVK
ncbi:amidohydrolase family protein [Aquiflexum sp.]|uniref:amidohydrolase family protein n=1 Tax=Aquiflexum sp. TaxID=1872584 RepID=UPI0035946181